MKSTGSAFFYSFRKNLQAHSFFFIGIALLGTMMTMSCKDDLFCEEEVAFSPNDYKFYLPYSAGESILFSDEDGNKDTINILTYDVSPANYNADECFQPSESVQVEMSLKLPSAVNACQINFVSALSRIAPFLLVDSPNCHIEATVSPSEKGSIKTLNNYSFEGTTYDRVIEIQFSDNILDIEEMVLAKDTGFLYLKIDDVVKKVVN